MGHENGRNLTGVSCIANGKGIMHTPTGSSFWSPCSKNDFINYYRKKHQSWCLPEFPKACTLSAGVCPQPTPDPDQTIFKHLGCFKDFAEGKFKGIPGDFKPGSRTFPTFVRYGFPGGVSVDSCYNELKNSVQYRNFKYFAIQHQVSCYVAEDLNELNKPLDEVSTDCVCGTGAESANDVYEIQTMEDPDFDHLGCFGDRRGDDRAIPNRIGHDGWGMTPTKCYELVINANKLIEDIDQIYTLFGVQVSTECPNSIPKLS